MGYMNTINYLGDERQTSQVQSKIDAEAEKAKQMLQGLLKDLHRLRPDFFHLPKDQQMKFLNGQLQHFIAAQRSPPAPQVSVKRPDSPSALINLLTPMHVVNHFNITINHPLRQLAGETWSLPELTRVDESQTNSNVLDFVESRNHLEEEKVSLTKGGQVLQSFQSEEDRSEQVHLFNFQDKDNLKKKRGTKQQDNATRDKHFSLSPEVKKNFVERVEKVEAKISAGLDATQKPKMRGSIIATNPKRPELQLNDTKTKPDKPASKGASKQTAKHPIQTILKQQDETSKKVKKTPIKPTEVTIKLAEIEAVPVDGDQTGQNVGPATEPKGITDYSSTSNKKLKADIPALSEDSSPAIVLGKNNKGFTQELTWGQNKRGVPTQQIYKEQLRVKIDFQGVDEPDCVLYAERNRCCKLIRARQRAKQRDATEEPPPQQPHLKPQLKEIKKPEKSKNVDSAQTAKSNDNEVHETKDLLVIVFDGVIGTFIRDQETIKCETKYEKLYLRPGVEETLTQLAETFQLAIIVDFNQERRLRAVKKAMANAPYDRLYYKTAWRHDNYFNVENIMNDFGLEQSRVLYLTACHFTGLSLLERNTVPAHFTFQKAINSHMNVTATAKDDFGLMPVALNLESLVVFAVPHIFTELTNPDAANLATQLDQQFPESNQSLVGIQVTSFTAFANPILTLQQISESLRKKHQLKRAGTFITPHKEKISKKLSSFQPKQEIVIVQHAGEYRNTLSTDNEDTQILGNSRVSKQKKNEEQNLIKETAIEEAVPSKFKILTDVSEYDIFNPISSYLQQFSKKPARTDQHSGMGGKRRSKKQKYEQEDGVLSKWKENAFCMAFNKIKCFDMLNSMFFQPERFNREILGSRIKPVMLKIKLKLKKIAAAMKVVNAYTQKRQGMNEEDRVNEFYQRQQRNDKLRHQVAFQTFQDYNRTYFQEIYDECAVRLPLHPTRDQLVRLQQVYKTMYTRLEDLITQRYKTGKDIEFTALSPLTKLRMKNAGIEDFESRMKRLEDPDLKAFNRYMDLVARHNKEINADRFQRDAYPYSIVVLQSHLLAQGTLVLVGDVKCTQKFVVHETYAKAQRELMAATEKVMEKEKQTQPERKVRSLLDWMCQDQRAIGQKQVNQKHDQQQVNEQSQ